MRGRLHQQRRGCRPSLIENDSACAGLVRYHSIENLAVALVGVEAFIKKIAEPAPRLRGSKCKRVSGRSCCIRSILEPRSSVSHGGESKTGHRRVHSHIGELIRLAGLEATLQRHRVSRERPFFAWNSHPAGTQLRADPERVL